MARTARIGGGLLLAAVGIASVVACDPRTIGVPARRPDVVVVVVDALRRDHLDLYGYGRATGPSLRRLAADGVVFTNAYSTSSWATPAVGSLLTGLYPHRLGGGMPRRDHFTLAEYLRPAGYRTVAIHAQPAFVGDAGFIQGFDEVAERARAPADAVIDVVLERLRRADPARPLLLYVHLSDPRGPYAPPARFLEAWPPAGEGPFDPSRIDPATPARVMADLIAAYDAEIAFVDAEIGRLVDALRSDGRYDDAMIVVTASHGEELQEHGAGGHGRTLFEEVIAVPLVMKFPLAAGSGSFVHGPVSVVDIVPTILPVAGVRTTGRLDGTDLALITADQGQALRDRPLFFSLELPGSEGASARLRAVLHQVDKYIRRDEPEPRGALYRLALDPFEQRDVVDTEENRARRLERLLRAPSKPAPTVASR